MRSTAAGTKVLRPALNDAGVRVLARDNWNAKQTRWLRAYFRDEILPVLSPLGLDPAHPFPKILNKSLNIVVVLKGKDAFGRAGHLAIVRAPRSLPRIIQLPHKVSGGEHDFVFLSAVLSAFVDELFPGMEVKGAYQFRVTRNSELIVDEEEVENLALALRDELVGRGYLRAMRLEIADNCPKPIVRTLLENFELPENAVYRINGPVNLNRVIQVYDLVQRPELKFAPFQPARTARRRCDVRARGRGRRAAAPSLRRIHPGAGTDPPGRRRPERARDQADPVPHRPRIADRRTPGAGPRATART
jgi:polyphosphate kinase